MNCDQSSRGLKTVLHIELFEADSNADKNLTKQLRIYKIGV